VTLDNFNAISHHSPFKKRRTGWQERGYPCSNNPLRNSPNAKWHREDKDGFTGPKAPIDNVTWQLHNALQYSWAKYGSLTKVNSGGDFGVEYGYFKI